MTRRDVPGRRDGFDGSNNGDWNMQNAVNGARNNREATLQTRGGLRHLNQDESTISPGTVSPPGAPQGANYFDSLPPVPPKDRGGMASIPGNHRHELAAIHNPASIPSISRDPPSAPLAQIAPWANEPNTMPSTALPVPSRSFFDDGLESLQSSPSYRPGTGRTDTSNLTEPSWPQDDRRPSVASTSTMNSQESGLGGGGSNRSHKKLAGFFGEDPTGRSPKGSMSNVPMHSHQRSRNSSFNTVDGRHISPASSRPRTPVPSSDVVPWAYQDPNDITHYGDAPVRQVALDKHPRFEHEVQSPPSAGHLSKFHFPHRHTRSKEEGSKKSPTKDSYNGYLPRPSTGRDDSPGMRNVNNYMASPGSPMLSRAQLTSRATSPTPSSNPISQTNRDIQDQRSPAEGSTSAKRSIFDKLRGRKADKNGIESLKSLPGSGRSSQDTSASNSKFKLDPLPPKKHLRDGSVATFDSGSTLRASDTHDSRKESKTGLLPNAIRRRGFGNESASGKDGEKPRNDSPATDTYWGLNMDINNIEEFVSAPPTAALKSGAYTNPAYTGGLVTGESQKEGWDPEVAGGPEAWDAPDSWAVKRLGDDGMARLTEPSDAGCLPEEEDAGIPYCVRVFRIDSTFATLSTGINTTVSEILQILGKKSFLQDELNNYQIIMRKHGLQRQLALGERPVAIQKRLLEQAGYESTDRIEEVGREDNSYLCRFTFVPTKIINGYYTLDKDPGFAKMSKFSHIDLSGKSLVTIPILLYKKAAEIISLNLSRNLALDVPKDFIQSCGNLREIKYTSNEAWQLPPSFALASRLTVLDISNNRLEQLDHIDFTQLGSLISIKISNNKLRQLPRYFGDFKSLRSLNLSSNYLQEFPDFLYNLRSLIDLDISFNSIQSLPKIGQLTSLERLWATNNSLSGSFPDDIGLCYSMKEIDVRFNSLSSIDVLTQLPNLENLMAGHNAISKFEGSFSKLRTFHLDHNPVTRFDLKSYMPSLTSLKLASAKIAELDDSLFERIPNITKLNLDKNHFASLSTQIGKLRKLEYFSMAKNPLSALPATIGCLQELRFLDVRECNLKKLPVELWCCLRLDTLNVSSNVLESFPKPTATFQPPFNELSQGNGEKRIAGSSATPASPAYEELGALEDFGHRRPSQASGGLLSVGSSPGTSTRKGSMVSVYGQGGRKASIISRAPTETSLSPSARKDSNLSNRFATTFAGSLRHLYLADNRLNDEVFDVITLLPEIRVLNLSYNDLDDITPGAFRRWPNLCELYLSGNELTSLPSDDLQETSTLKVLYINGNKFQVLPAELGKVKKLAILDVGSNTLKYNVSNWPYDWNWNWNPNLKYLNFSGNKRLEIKPNLSYSSSGSRENIDFTNFNSLIHLRVLGLMDVTLTIPSVPDQTEDRRVRTSGSSVGSMLYGMADTIGKSEHLSTIDMLVPKFRGHDTETLVGMFDGQALSTGGSKVAKFLHENFSFYFCEELAASPESPGDALRRAFLALNKELATLASLSIDEKEHRLPPQTSHRGSSAAQVLSAEDLQSGGVATVMFLDNMELYVANVGDAQAMLMHSDGGYRILTRKHDPADPRERQRIREAGGYVSRHGKLNDVLDVSRAFGYIQMTPAVMAAPDVMQVSLKEQDEMVLIASRELWDYVTPDVVVDVARSERADLMRAAQKLRDLAIAFGATRKLMVMMIGISDLKRRERNRYRGQILSMGPAAMQEDAGGPSRRPRRPRDAPDDSTLARLDHEVDAPTGELSLIFTDIVGSTPLWETYPTPMRSAIKIHNELMRRQLRIIGGYEVKTEGDAFIVAFPTATSALLWCFSVQILLLSAPWPTEILESPQGREILDADGNTIYRGISVRMGIHWGAPVFETDPVTRRMDYFGPMVNRAARISAEASGGQINVSSDYIAEIHRTLGQYAESDRSGSTGSEDTYQDDALAQSIRRDLRLLSTQGFEVKDKGERKLKGLENPEYIYLMYPHALAGRLVAQRQKADADAAALATGAEAPANMPHGSQLSNEGQSVWDLWAISLRLEMLCGSLECPGLSRLKTPETGILERMKDKGGEVTDKMLVQFVEHLVSRVEMCVNSLAIRNLARPFVPGQSLLEQAAPMEDILSDLAQQMTELKMYKREQGTTLLGA